MSNLLQVMPLPYEPKRKNRWLVRFPSSLGIQEWWLASAARPSIEQSEVEIPFLNTSTWILGRFKWSTIDIVFRDPIGPSASQAIMEWVRLGSESITGRQGYASSYMKDADVEMLDPSGVVIEKWKLEGSFLTNVNFGSLAMDDDGIAEITATLRMQRAILLF
jgi:hypothetical protein